MLLSECLVQGLPRLHALNFHNFLAESFVGTLMRLQVYTLVTVTLAGQNGNRQSIC